MGKTVENPKKFIISCRIDDHEMETLQQIAKNNGTSISTLLRRSLSLLDQGSHQAPQAHA